MEDELRGHGSLSSRVPSEILDLIVVKRERRSHKESGRRNSGFNLCLTHHSVSAGEHRSTGSGYNPTPSAPESWLTVPKVTEFARWVAHTHAAHKNPVV